MIGAEWPDGEEPAVQPETTYFLKIERADGQGIYCYASDGNPYASGNAFVGGRSLPGVDFYGVIRGLTREVNTATGTLTGVVEDTGNAPIEGATLTTDPANRTAVTDAAGAYTLTGVPIGLYRVTASRTGYKTESVSGVEILENQVTAVDFTLERSVTTGTLRGSVRDGSGNPLAGVDVSTTVGGYRAVSDAGGGYLIGGIEAGTYTVEARKTGFVPYSRSGVTVVAGETTLLDIQLSPNVDAPPAIVNPDFEDDRGFFSVARGWTRFGGNKWEAVWDAARVFTQGIADVPPSGSGGVYQTIAVTPGRRYRVTVHAKTTTADYEVAVGVDPGGQANPAAATFGSPSRAASWTAVATEFTAAAANATIFLRAKNTRAQFVAGWAQFDAVRIESLGGGGNLPPTAVASANPTSGTAPLAVQFDGRASSDPEGASLSFDWDFGDGSPHATGATASHTYSAAGTLNVVLTVDDGAGGRDADTLTITVTAPGGPVNLVTNGDFARGLEGWSVWTERGNVNARVENGQLALGSSNHNGGVTQRFSTGGAGKEISVSGFWASNPTVARQQWAEVLIINGSRQPVNGQDINAGQADVVLLYKNDTWASPNGWSGEMAQTAPLARRTSFVAVGAVATLVLKSGNAGGALTGTRFDNISVTGPAAPPPGNTPPRAVATAQPTSGDAPLAVQFDGSGSSDADGDPLSYSWSFGNGQSGAGVKVGHTYQQAGTYTATLTVSDGRGGSTEARVNIQVNSPGPGGPNLVANGGFESAFSNGLATGWTQWSLAGSGYWKSSSRLGRIGSGSYGSSTQAFNAVTRLNPKVVLLEGNALGMASALRSALPDARIVGRLFIDHLVSQYLSNPELYGRKHAEDCFNQNRPEVNAWQGMNEPDVNNVENARRVARFEKAFSDRLHELGLKSVVLNIAVGNPGNMDNMLLPEIVDLLAGADYVGYHAYGGIKDQLMVGPESPWFAHRFRTYLKMYRERGYRMPPVLYTECTTFYAWKRGYTEPGYAPFEPWQIRDDLIAFERESRQDPWAVGMAIFLLGSSSPRWDGWEVSNEPVIYQGAGDDNFNRPADAKAGLFAQQFGGNASELTGGILQAIDVEPGARYRLSLEAKHETYGPNARVGFRVGYDLTGQTANARAPSVVWSDDLIALEARETDIWYGYSRSFTASGSRASIWIEGAGPGYPRFRISVDEVKVHKEGGGGVNADAGVVWIEEPMEEFTGSLVRGWSPWFQGNGEREWNRVLGESGWAQEVKKSNVQVGILRENRGFLAGDTYRVTYRAKHTIGSGTPQASVGVRAGGGVDPAGVTWGPAVAVSRNAWNDVRFDFAAPHWTTTIFLRVDLNGVQDGGVALDNVRVERITPRSPPAWMLEGSPPAEPRHIHGMHDPGAEHLFNQKARQGWVVHAIAIGDDPANTSGQRFSEWVDGHGVIVRVSYGFGDTLPHPSRFSQFAQRAANFVKSSVGAGIWSIANEPGLERAESFS
jgi:PKD repeat protein